MANETPLAAGALGFHTLCEYCNKVIAVRSDGEAFRYERHPMPGDGPWKGLDCPRSELRWEAR